MLNGKVVTMRPVLESDLPALYEHTMNLENRGEFYPRTFQTMTALKKEMAETGFWSNDWGLLLLVDNESRNIVGQIVWFKTVQYMDELEIGYIMYDQSTRSRGGMTEALKLLTRYLFDTKQVNRLRLCIVTENGPSRRVAEKGGYTHEGTQRGCFFNRGKHHDMELYAFLRGDLPAES